MANGKIVIDPSLLMSQSAEMIKLTNDYDQLFSSVSSSLSAMNGRWSANLSNNFAAKIQSAGSVFTVLTELLKAGSDSAKVSAETFQSLDTSLDQTFAQMGIGGALKDAVNTSWGQIRDSWNQTGVISDQVDQWYDSLPEWIKQDIEKVTPEGAAVLHILRDITNGDVSVDTLGDYLSGIGASSPEVTAITSILKHCTDENGFVNEMMNYSYGFDAAAGKCFRNGDILGGLENYSMSVVSKLCAATDTFSEAVTEIGSSAVERVGNFASGILDATGNFIEGTAGEILTGAGNIIDSGTKTITGWLSGLF